MLDGGSLCSSLLSAWWPRWVRRQRAPTTVRVRWSRDLASFGDGSFVTGSTIGPHGALYVTDGSAGSVLRIDRRSGRVTTYATGLPPKAFATDIGGPVDVAFVGGTAYVLVTLVSGEITGVGPFGDANDKNGIYRLERDGSSTPGR